MMVELFNNQLIDQFFQYRKIKDNPMVIKTTLEDSFEPVSMAVKVFAFAFMPFKMMR